MVATNPGFWEDLLQAIEEGAVVPVVGRDLLVVEDGAGPELYHHVLARRLARDLGVAGASLPAGFDTNDVLCAHEEFHGDAMAISPRVVRLARALKFDPPEPFRLLAEIPAFSLFVSTTFDTLLEEALVAVRGAPPACLAFPAATGSGDLPDGLHVSAGTTVFQILGRLSASSPFALTEGQVLELMHDFMAGPRRPERLLGRLRESHLLLLGVSFPDWLARLLLRLARAKPLWDSRPMMEFIADGSPGRDELAVFLRNFSPRQSRLFSGGSPVEFVRELHRRWFERHPAGARRDSSGPAEEAVLGMARGSVFISYAKEDRVAAFRMADRLTDMGIETWVDRRLNPGDDYRSLIERHIRDCSAFIPLISKHTQTEDERWFRREWRMACERAHSFFGTDRSFLFPVVVDDTSVASMRETRTQVFTRSAIHAPGGEPPARLADELMLAQRLWRRQYTRT